MLQPFLKMIDFPARKRHFNVLFRYTMAAHLPRHTLRPVLLFCVYTHFSEIVTFFVDGGSIRFFVGFLSPAPSPALTKVLVGSSPTRRAGRQMGYPLRGAQALLAW